VVAAHRSAVPPEELFALDLVAEMVNASTLYKPLYISDVGFVAAELRAITRMLPPDTTPVPVPAVEDPPAGASAAEITACAPSAECRDVSRRVIRGLVARKGRKGEVRRSRAARVASALGFRRMARSGCKKARRGGGKSIAPKDTLLWEGLLTSR